MDKDRALDALTVTAIVAFVIVCAIVISLVLVFLSNALPAVLFVAITVYGFLLAVFSLVYFLGGR